MMREAVARALCDYHGDDWSREGEPITAYFDMAAAVLEAMRSPTPEMVEAGEAATEYSYVDIVVSNVYTAMIDKARERPGEGGE